MGALSPGRIVKEQITEHRVGVEPTLPRYEGGVFAAGRPVLEMVEGLELRVEGQKRALPGSDPQLSTINRRQTGIRRT